MSFIGDGGSSLGEWHEAINLCAARRLPAIFCIENNQIALSTPLSSQSAARVFADKARGYGIPGITIDGTDPDEVAAAFALGGRPRASGPRPGAHRARDDAHGRSRASRRHAVSRARSPRRRWNYPPLSPGAYADRDGYARWTQKDPIASYAARLEAEQVIAPGDLEGFKKDAVELVDAEARAVIDAPWPNP